MSEKTGFFRRVFSFGQPEETAPERLADAAPLHETTEVAQHDSAAEVLPPTDEQGALAPTHPQSGPAILIEAARPSDEWSDDGILEDDAAPASADIPAPVAADEPAWLDPDAPEPEADFSWLEDGAAEVTPSSLQEDSEPSVDTPVEDEQPGPEPIFEPDPAHPAISDPVMETPAAPATTGTASEGDFSFLDPDAPLPEEEEDADFSWLEAEAPLPDAADETPGTASIASGAGGVALASGTASGASALPRSGDEGWRLREAAPTPTAPAARITWFERLREGLSRSSNQLSGSITSLFTKRRLDEATLQEFEDVLLQADLGVETALRITDRLSEGRFGKEITGDQVRQVLADEVEATLAPVALPLELDLEKKPHVILVVGVNGTGKTTTIGKLAAKLTRGGLKVTLCAGDTFRAAAVEQLKIWGERTGSEVIAKQIGADAAGLAFEAYDAAVENGSDVLIIDTAGRLQNKAELMAELEKIVRVLQKREPDAPHTVLQTLDATTGQNALSQVEIFRNVAGVNGLVMTKLDGTARGGILVAIAAKYRLPVYFIGVGEGIDDLEPFKARDFAMAIAGKA